LPRVRDIAGCLRRATPLLFYQNFRGVPFGLDCRCCDSRSKDPKLIIRVINFELVQPAHGTSISQTERRTDRRTDRRTTYDSNTPLTLRASRGKKRKNRRLRVTISRMRRNAPFEPTDPNTWMWGEVPDVINRANFFWKSTQVSLLADPEIWHFQLTLLVVLTTLSLALPCERVIDPHYWRRRCSPMTLDSCNIRFMRILAEVPWRRGVKLQWGNPKRRPRFSGFRTLRLRHLRKGLRIFRRRTVAARGRYRRNLNNKANISI